MSKIEEKIDKASEMYVNTCINRCRLKDKRMPQFSGYDLGTAFELGAKWALSNQWISVAEELPPKTEDVLVVEVRGNYHNFGIAWCDNNPNGTIKWYSEDDDLCKESIQYWMPIPPLPEARKEGER